MSSDAEYDGEYQRLNSIACDHVSGSLRCGTFLADVIATRNHWRKVVSGGYGMFDNDEAHELYQLAVEAIGPVIHEAIRRQREHDALAEQARQERDARKQKPSTEHSLVSAMDEWHERVANAKAENNGCCGGIGVPDETGYCFGVGYCPRVKEARACEKFLESYLAWLETIQEQSALAAVAVRLSGPPSLEMGVENIHV